MAKTATAAPELDEPGAPATPESTTTVTSGVTETTIDSRPLVVQFFDRLGIEQGSRFAEVWTVNGQALSDATVVTTTGTSDGHVAIVFRESGVSGEHIIQWAHITRLVRR